MINTLIATQGNALRTIQDLLRRLLEGGTIDALLVPMLLPTDSVAPMLVTDPAALDQADPLTPVMPINAARAASQLTMTGHKEKLGVVLRSCEIRALVELVKFQQADLDKVLIIGLDCPGTYSVTAWQDASSKQIVLDELLAGAARGEPQSYQGPSQGPQFRAACQMCEQPLPTGDHVALSIGLVGVPEGQLYLQARQDVAEALELEEAGVPEGRQPAVETYLNARLKARDDAFSAFRQRVNSMDGLLQEFSTCIRCHNCMINCPICYCKECIFRTPTFEHESQLYYQWAERKGTVQMMPDTLLFHLTRLNHMVTSCVGCGICADVCPVDIPVGTVFRAVGEKVQAIFEYHPGQSLEEAAPVQEFREEELTTMGERSHS
jgi:formate dehydrogenase subunit beta